MKKTRILALMLSALVLLSGCTKPAEPTETGNFPSTGIEEQTKNEVPPSSSESNSSNARPTDTDAQETVPEEVAKVTPQSEPKEKEPPDGEENTPDKSPTQGSTQPPMQENVQPPAPQPQPAQPQQTAADPQVNTAEQPPTAPTQAPDCLPLTFTVELTTQPTESDPPQQAEPAPPPPAPPASESAPAPTPAPDSVPAPVPSFDVSACVQNAVDYGTGIGLVYDSTAMACWDDPLTANAQSLYTERDLRDRLDWYRASGFTSFCVWSEPVGDSSYLVYIGYA